MGIFEVAAQQQVTNNLSPNQEPLVVADRKPRWVKVTAD
jgi:hypothetical protein